eukprot:1222790-Pleurochrysis_carterae.AAC.1
MSVYAEQAGLLVTVSLAARVAELQGKVAITVDLEVNLWGVLEYTAIATELCDIWSMPHARLFISFPTPRRPRQARIS